MTSIISIRYSDIDVRSVIAKAAKAVPTENTRSGDLPLCASVDWQVLTSKDRKLDCEEGGIVHGEKWGCALFRSTLRVQKILLSVQAVSSSIHWRNVTGRSGYPRESRLLCRIDGEYCRFYRPWNSFAVIAGFTTWFRHHDCTLGSARGSGIASAVCGFR